MCGGLITVEKLLWEWFKMVHSDESSGAAIAELHRLLEGELEKSAVMAWTEAAELCWRDPDSGVSCLEYHRIWQILLLLKVTKSLQTDAGFLLQSYRSLFRKVERCRVLVSGAADYGLLAHLLWAAELEKVRPHITVVDRCQTSLMLNSWYAKRRGLEIEPVHEDILDFVPDQPFHLICTHSFLGWFSPESQGRLLRRWREMLSRDGVVITSIRLRPGSNPHECRPFNSNEVHDLRQKVEKAYRDSSLAGAILLAEILETVEAYCRSRSRYSFVSTGHINQLFNTAGLRITGFNTGSNPEASLPSGPREGAAGRVNLIAARDENRLSQCMRDEI